MPRRSKKPRIPQPRACGLYVPGHDVHFIQARLAGESEIGESVIEDVANDGTIPFADGRKR